MGYRWLLLGLLSTCAFADQPNPQRQQELLNMLKHDCGSCHGLPPKGGLGPSLMPEVLADKSDALLIDAIQNGRAGTAMPPWKNFLTVDETAWLIQQLRKR
ncbi:cytochrome C55X precursor NirC [Methylomonas methanica]|uniref:Cytochrome C55X NirC n=2 Tax=Methylomonas methanica TaxID=421 RepID=A0A177M0H9_METMH|nr:cytochrome C55X precursor NirC [Methylomonas methanica]OAI01392.1 cytochrome C55X precursor NirC [Methylomonas methanica]